MIVEFTPDQYSFGCNSLKSFIYNLDYYQSTVQILHNDLPLDFKFTNQPTNSSALVVDIFEFYQGKPIIFRDVNVIVVETLRQLVDLIESNCFDLGKKYIIFSESWWDETKYQWPKFDYSLIYFSWEIDDVKNRLANASNVYHHIYDVDMVKKYNPAYDFLCLVGRGKWWRDQFIDKLKSELNLSNSLTSYFGESIGHSDLITLDIPYSRSKLNFEKEFYSPQGNAQHQYEVSYFTKPELFYKTKFSIVVETEAEYNEYHVTEKTLKCLITGHPFVVMGTPRYLEFLKNLGFMTCNHLFSENYDQIDDLEKRMNAVVALAKKLQISYTFNRSDLDAMQTHNIKNLFRLKNTASYKNFLELFND